MIIDSEAGSFRRQLSAASQPTVFSLIHLHYHTAAPQDLKYSWHSWPQLTQSETGSGETRRSGHLKASSHYASLAYCSSDPRQLGVT